MRTDLETPETEYARRLRAELRSIVAARGNAEEAGPASAGIWRRRGIRSAFAATVLAALIAAILTVGTSGTGTTAAWAVSPKADGRVSVEIRDLTDPRGLERALGAAGVPVTVAYRAGAHPDPCRRAASPRGGGAGGAPVGIGISRSAKGPTRFSVRRDALAPGQTIHLTATTGLVFISFIPRERGGEKLIEASPTALLRCIEPGRSGPLLEPRR